MARKTIILVILGIFLFGLIGCHHEWMPQDGDWYCEALQIQVSYSTGECFWINNGDIVSCDCINNRGSKVFSIIMQEFDDEDIPLGSELFCAEYVELTDDSFVVKEIGSGKIYTFFRIDPTYD